MWSISDWFSINETRKKESGLTALWVSSNDSVFDMWIWISPRLVDQGSYYWRSTVWWPKRRLAEEARPHFGQCSWLLQNIELQNYKFSAPASPNSEGESRIQAIHRDREQQKKTKFLVSSVDTVIHLLTRTGVLLMARNAWSGRNRDISRKFVRVHKWTL